MASLRNFCDYLGECSERNASLLLQSTINFSKFDITSKTVDQCKYRQSLRTFVIIEEAASNGMLYFYKSLCSFQEFDSFTDVYIISNRE